MTDGMTGIGRTDAADAAFARDGAGRTAASPTDEDVRAFERLMEREGGGKRDAAERRDAPDAKDVPDARPQTLPEGDDFLTQLFRAAGEVAGPGTGRAEGAQAAGTDADALEALVSRILVNTPEKGGSEVRLLLNDAAFRNTEITLARDLSGLLSVRIVTGDEAVRQSLVAARNDLLQALEASESAPVRVDIDREAQPYPEGSGEDAAEGRSRGLNDEEGGY